MADVVRVVGGRLESAVDPRLQKHLYPGPLSNLRHSYFAFHAFDKAHTVSLAEAGLIPLSAARAILAGLRQMEAEGITEARDRMGGGRHSGEAYLTQLIGPDDAGWINLGRSSGDLDATAWRMVFRAKAVGLLDALTGLRSTLLGVAGKHLDTVLPGMTCLQHAQTTTLAHTMVAWEAPLGRDCRRLLAAYDAAGASPAGSGIMTGSTFPLLRSRTAELLGFETVAENTRDAVLNLDILMEAHTAAAICLSNLMRIAEDLYLWSSSEFGYVDIPDPFCSTSSIMPQKKNPWGLAWIRGQGSLLLGRLGGTFTLLKAESDQLEATMLAAWELWAVIEPLEDMVRALAGAIEGATFRVERMKEMAASHFCQATDLAAMLVTEAGLPWREAHQLTARVVREAIAAGMKPLDLTPEFVNKVRTADGSGRLNIRAEALAKALDPRGAVVAREGVVGSPAPGRVAEQLKAATARVRDDEARVSSLKKRAEEARSRLEKAIDALTGGETPRAR